MKTLLPLTLAALVAVPLLSGCPDNNKVPKAPPIPAPKAAMHSIPDTPPLPSSVHVLPRGIRAQA